MRLAPWLALVPVVLNLAGVLLAPRIHAFVFGLPFLLVWVVGCVFVTVAVMAVVYRLDPANRDDR